MNSLDRHSLEEQTRLVSRYVAGDLSRSERAEFEAWLVASPELAAEVEMERRLRRGIASAARRGWLKRNAQAPRPAAVDQRWRYAIAASVVVSLVTVGVTVVMPDRGSPDAPDRVASVSVLPHLGPTMKIWHVLDEHPDAYEFFRNEYHQQLRSSPYRVALQSLAVASRKENFTLIHAAEDAEHNAAMALYEYLTDLEAYCPPDAD